MDEITLDDKTYVSSKRAAAITGYAKDYVGQLCREGRVEARLVGRNWYILESSIREHRFGKEEKKEPVKTEDGAYEPANYASEEISEIPMIESSQGSAEEAASIDHATTVQEMQSAWQDWFTRKSEQLPDELEEELLESAEIIDARAEVAEEESEFPADDEEEIVNVVKMIPESQRVVREAPPYQPEYAEINSNRGVLAEQDEEVVPIHRSYVPPAFVEPARVVHQPTYSPSARSPEPVYASPRPEGRILRERRVTKKKKPSVALQALFLSIAGIAIAVALIGSGKADTFLNQNRIQYAPINFLGGETVVNKTSK